MDGSGRFNGFDLDDDFPFDNDVGPEGLIEVNVLVSNRERELSLQPQPSFTKLVCQHHLVDGLQKSRTKFSVHAECGIQDDFRYLVLSHRDHPLRS